ncbi:MAG: hypothetical protein J6C59_04385 [Muribaculaceae bacterium]|jgi:hypothetical protein|nr:hypothetical protein [Muribaculaceae bacterium]
MEKQLSKIEVSEPAKTPAIDERLIRNILLLHFKQGLPAESIGHIFSIPKATVEEKISNFAGQFSDKEYLMNVINALVPMNNRKEKGTSDSSDPDAKDREIAELKKKLTEAEIRAEVYLETIRLAESTFGISIRKKSGAK